MASRDAHPRDGKEGRTPEACRLNAKHVSRRTASASSAPTQSGMITYPFPIRPECRARSCSRRTSLCARPSGSPRSSARLHSRMSPSRCGRSRLGSGGREVTTDEKPASEVLETPRITGFWSPLKHKRASQDTLRRGALAARYPGATALPPVRSADVSRSRSLSASLKGCRPGITLQDLMARRRTVVDPETSTVPA